MAVPTVRSGDSYVLMAAITEVLLAAMALAETGVCKVDLVTPAVVRSVMQAMIAHGTVSPVDQQFHVRGAYEAQRGYALSFILRKQ